MPKVSVLMPVYNAEPFLAEAINSILGQTFSDYEFLIINDGSTDRSKEIIRSFHDPRIVYLENENNSGIVFTLNRGLSCSAGEYIVRMDADDVSLPERIEKQVQYMDEHPEVAVCGTNLQFVGSRSGISEMPVGIVWNRANLFFMTSVAHPSVIIRKSVLTEHHLSYDPFFERMEDFDLWCRISRFAQIDNLKDVLLQYRVHEKQITQNHVPEETERWKTLKKRELAFLDFEYSQAEFDAYIQYCFSFQSLDYPSLLDLVSFMKKAISANHKVRYYDEYCLILTFKNCLWYCYDRVPLRKKEARQLLKSADFIEKPERVIRSRKIKIKNLVKKISNGRVATLVKSIIRKIKNAGIKMKKAKK